MSAIEPDAGRPRSRTERWGDDLAHAGRDFVRSASASGISPRAFLSGAIAAAQTSAAGLWTVLPSSRSPNAWLEGANKLPAYRLFAFADTLVAEADRGWDAAESRLREMDPSSRVWVTEGLGYYFAQRGIAPAAHAAAADRLLIPMHTGAGLSLAEHALRNAGPDLHTALARYRDRAWTLARDGLGEVVYEALGLVAVTLYPDLVGPIDRELAADDRLSALFWHGVGRGLYFLPLHFLPVSRVRRRPVEFASNTPTTDLGRRNALAGLAWAMTLVNVQDPDVVMEWLDQHAPGIEASEAFRNGVASALTVWMAAAPDEASIAALDAYQPPSGEALWEDFIRQAIAAARRAGGSPAHAATVFRVRPFA